MTEIRSIFQIDKANCRANSWISPTIGANSWISPTAIDNAYCL